MQDYSDERALGWAGHVARMPLHRWPRQMLSSYLPYPRPLGAPQKTHGRSLTAALAREGIPVASWLTWALDRTNWRQAINSVPAMPSTPTNHIGRTIEMGNGSCMQGIVTGTSYLSDGPEWQVALDNGKTTNFPYNGLKTAPGTCG
jgi:hypothetical protein